MLAAPPLPTATGTPIPPERVASGLERKWREVQETLSMMDPAMAGVTVAAEAMIRGVVETAKDVETTLSVFGGGAPVGAEMRVGTPQQTGEALTANRAALAAAPRMSPTEIAEHEARVVRGTAFLGALALEEGLVAFKIARPLLNRAAGGVAGGGLYGLLRPHEDGESMVDAILKDAALFGGVNLGMGAIAGAMNRSALLAAAQQDAVNGGIELARAGQRLRGEITAAERLSPLPETARGFEVTGVRATPPVPTTPTLLEMQQGITPRMIQDQLDAAAATKGRTVGETVAVGERLLESERGAMPFGPAKIPPEIAERMQVLEHPRDLGLYGAYVAPSHTWAKVNPIAGQIVDDAGSRWNVARTVYEEWKTLIDKTKGALKRSERVQLGNLLDQYVRGEELPEGTPQKLADWFGLWRERLNKDRGALQTLLGATPDWGIDAYFMHVFAGDWRIVDAAGKAIGDVPQGGFFKSFAEARQAAVDYLTTRPEAQITLKPNKFLWDQDNATALGPRQYWRFVRSASDALNLDASDVQSMLREGKVTRPRARAKWFGHTQERAANLQGFIADPTEAADVYARGLGRKLAFHDFEAKALAMMEQIPAEQPFLKATLGEYVSRVLGRPGQIEQGWNNFVKFAMSQLPERARIVGERSLSLGNLATGIRKFESLWRLGWSPMSAFVNYSQTWVNTASKIGYGPTLKAHRLLLQALGDSKLAGELDTLLKDLGVEYQVHLAASDIYKSVGNLAPWHPLYLFNKAETVNRSVAGLAGYVNALDAGASRDAAISAAKKLINETQFIYNVTDLSALLANPIGQVVGQFKPFLINELHFMAGLRGAEIGRFLINITAAGGVTALFSLPPLALLNLAVDALTGESITERMQQKAPAVSRGLPGMVGIDAGSNVGIGGGSQVIDLRPGPGVNDLVALLRLVPDAAKRIIDGNGTLSADDRARLARQLMQAQVRRFLDAYHVARDGVVVQPTTGVPIYTPADPVGATIATALGVRTVEKAEHEREINVVKGLNAVEDRERRGYIERILKARADGNTDEATRLRQEAARRGIVVTNDMINAAREGDKTALERALQQISPQQRRTVRQRAITQIITADSLP